MDLPTPPQLGLVEGDCTERRPGIQDTIGREAGEAEAARKGARGTGRSRGRAASGGQVVRRCEEGHSHT